MSKLEEKLINMKETLIEDLLITYEHYFETYFLKETDEHNFKRIDFNGKEYLISDIDYSVVSKIIDCIKGV